ncbi:MAG: sugar ABC transporter permease [Clostridia bacterium]|nr:sugar ABC transporter permease [Clostridia bacterium]
MFHYMPMYGVIIAFKDYKPAAGIIKSDWVGFEHFIRFFKMPQFRELLKNTLTISIYSIAASFPFPVMLALAFNYIRSDKFKKVAQTVFYAPHFISMVVIVSIVDLIFAQKTGIVNVVRQMMGLEQIFYMGEPSAFPHLYVWSGIWQNTGWSAIIYMASLSGVDPSLHEAAILDGASKLQRAWYVDMKCIVPTMVTILILNMGQVMNVGFEKVFLMQNSLNISASEIISTYVYKRGMIEAQYSFSAAVGLFNSAINCTLVLLFNKLSKLMGSSGIL